MESSQGSQEYATNISSARGHNEQEDWQACLGWALSVWICFLAGL